MEDALRQINGLRVKSVWGLTLYHKQDLPFTAGKVPDVFSVFRKQVEDQSRVRPLVAMPTTLKPLPDGVCPGSIPTHADLG